MQTSRPHLQSAKRFVFTCILLFVPLTARAQITKTERFDFPPGGTLRIENSTDDLTIEGWDRPDVEITLVKSRKVYATEERDTSGLDAIRVTAETRGSELVVRTEFPRYDSFPPPLPFRGGAHFYLEYRIHAPRNAAVVVNHDTGDVHIDDIAGDVRVEVQKGGMTLRLPEDARYAIDARTDTGSIFSDFPARWHRRFWPLGARYEQNTAAGHKLYLRAGYGDIAILKIRKAPWGH